MDNETLKNMPPEKKKKIRLIPIIIVVLVIFFAIIAAGTGFLTDWLWFKEMGYVSVFFKEIGTKLSLGIPAFIIASVLAGLFLRILQSNFLSKGKLELSDPKDKRRIRLVTIVLSLVFGFVFTVMVVSELWFEILQFINASEFGITDPLFNNDLGFYIFKLEFLSDLAGAAVVLCVLLIILTIIFYILLVSFSRLRHDPDQVVYEYEAPSEKDEVSFNTPFGEVRVPRPKAPNSDAGESSFMVKLKSLLSVAATELMILGIMFFLALGARFWLLRYTLLYGGTGVAYGAGFTDITVSLNIYRIVMVCSVLAAIMLVVSVKRQKILTAVIFPAVILLALVIEAPLAGLVQNIIVAPDEISKEKKYIGYNIDYTQSAYNLKDISIRDFSPQNTLTKADVLDNMETFSNIRINDFEPAEQFYNQTQSIRSYYTFNDVDVDRYQVNGEYTQVFLSAREIDNSKVEDSWIIKHLKYTHGYGIALSRVDRVTSSGQPALLIDSIPPVSDVPEITITRPEIYFGESTNDYVIVGTNEQEFDYPSGESNVYCTYEGDAGINLGFFNRLLFAMREKSLKMLVSTNITSNSRILVYRNIMDRVNKIAPFLSYDYKPYMVVNDEGRLFWIIDAYTMSKYYPYSEPWQQGSEANYVRNSVKIVVDAYNGTTDFYICDANDPIAETLAKIYPVLFKPLDEMPEDLRIHLEYPNALFNIQANVYTKYHMNDEEVFYQNEDLWAIAKELYGAGETTLIPINFIMKLPGEQNAEFISSIPYTPSGKSNMTGLLVARSDGDDYGQLVLYRLPKDRIIYGPAQIEAQINQDAEISKEFSLWNNSGASYSRGNLFVFPVEDSLLYAEPIYMESSSSSLPEVKRVIMYYGDQVAYESTLAECLDSLFGAGTGSPLATDNPIETGHEMAAAIEGGAAIDIPQSGPDEPVEGTDGRDGSGASGEDISSRDQLVQLINTTKQLLEQMQQLLETMN